MSVLVRFLNILAVLLLAGNAYAQVIIVDNPAGTPTGSWPVGSTGSYYGSDSYINEAGSGADKFTWTATIAAPGYYKVYAWWPDGQLEHATDARYKVHHWVQGGGATTTVTVNQQQQAGQWNLLGTFPIAAGSASVELSDQANGRVAADAIKWEFFQSPYPAPPIPSIYPLADTYVVEGSSTAFGDENDLQIRDNVTFFYKRWAFLKFGISSLVPACQIANARLRLKARPHNGGTNLPLSIFAVADSSWSENLLNWGNQPAIGTALANTIITESSLHWYEWDVADYVRAECLAGRTEISFAAKSPSVYSGDAYVEVKSRETGTKPELRVNEYTATADSFTRSDSTSSNNGNSSELKVKGQSDARWIYLKFDLGTIPGGVGTVKLRLKRIGGGSAPIAVHPLANTTWGENTLTWANQPTPGSTALANDSPVNGMTDVYEWDVTSYAMAEYAAGRSVISLVLKSTSSGGDERRFASRESDLSGRPSLLVVPGIAPSVSVTSPSNNAVFQFGQSIVVTANASDVDGTIAKVDFFQGSTLLGTATSAPYSITWNGAPAGGYSLTARATDNSGGVTTSVPVAIQVNAPPTVSLTAPANGSLHHTPTSIGLTATAADTDGTIANVEYFHGGTLIGSSTVAPYAVTWAGAASGSYQVTAQATDNRGGVATSAAITVNVNASPTVSIATPANGSLHHTPNSIALTATAADSDGTITKVDYFHGATLIGTATAAPYSVTWSGAASGSYQVTAQATDDIGRVTTSAVITVNVNASPTVSITAPANGSFHHTPNSIALTATAADTDGTITKVDYFHGATLIGTATAAPYAVTWAGATAGSYQVTAQATDNSGGVTTSAAITVNVNASPTVSITSPASGATFLTPASIVLNATASDADGSIATVEFYQGTTLIGTSTSAPYTVTWAGAAVGSYQVTAQATDDIGRVTTSAAITIYVNALPTVSITSPSNNSSFAVGVPIPLAATASDQGGTVTKVEFYEGSNKLGESLTAPYGLSWNGAALGSYTVIAKAIDNQGSSSDSTPITINVVTAASVFFIHPDHLNTPRLVADATGTAVWRWDQQEPFGVNTPDENPSALGSFEFPLRFPGQYADKESGLNQNWYRDFDTSVGRYVQSDLIGLLAGLNTYSYVRGDPIGARDPIGLADNGIPLSDSAFVCRGGTCAAGNFVNGKGVTLGSNGLLGGVSVQSMSGKSVLDLSCKIPHPQIGVTTVGQIRAMGGNVVSTPSAGNPYHATLSGVSPSQAEALFTPTIKNPSKMAAGVAGKAGGVLFGLSIVATPQCRANTDLSECFCALNALMLGQDSAACRRYD